MGSETERGLLGGEAAGRLFRAGMASVDSDGRVMGVLSAMEKGAGDGIGLAGTIVKLLSGAKNVAKGTLGMGVDSIKALPTVAAVGAGTGVLGAMGIDALMQRMEQDDPEARINADIDAMYSRRGRELEDAAWMEKVRGMRDELRRGYRRMPTEEYAAKYRALMDALDERK